MSGVANGREFADLLWGTFGPKTSEWVAKGLPRPSDSPDGALELEIFDFDIAILSPGKHYTPKGTSPTDSKCRRPSGLHRHGIPTPSTPQHGQQNIRAHSRTSMRHHRRQHGLSDLPSPI